MAKAEKEDEGPSQFWISFKDSVVAIVILVNAMVMGMSADIEWAGWDILEIVFTVFFIVEMVDKWRMNGVGGYFCGDCMYWNRFDFIVVTIAIIDLLLSFVIESLGGEDSLDLSKFTIIKMARLGRLARLVRLLRFRMFKELLMMIQGVFAGLRVLFWAIVLFFFFIFLLAMLLRNLYGEDEDVIPYTFHTVPWAMFTLFRCFTDGCSTYDGTPLTVHLFDRYGASFMIGYMLVFLFVTIGLFNLIMAIFVDNVMESSRQRKQCDRERNTVTLELQLRKVVTDFVSELLAKGDEWAPAEKTRTSTKIKAAWRHITGNAEEGERKSIREQMDVQDMQVEREVFNCLVEDDKMVETLEALDIATSNRWELFDVLDADVSGVLDLEELIVGLMNLRGPAEKSDTVGTLLCARAAQATLMDMREEVRDIHKQIKQVDKQKH